MFRSALRLEFALGSDLEPVTGSEVSVIGL